MEGAASVIGLPLNDLDTPVLVVDLDIMQANIERMARVFRDAGTRWRPHIKGIKVPAIAHELLEAGAIGITCAKLGEAEVMAAAGIRDILVANQIVGPRKVMRLAALCRRADPIATVDGVENVCELSRAADYFGVTLRVVIEVDCGLGRCGVQPGGAVVELAQKIAESHGLRFVGLMTWEGHTVRIDSSRKAAAVEESLSLLMQSADACRKAGLPVDIVSCGGTGNYWLSASVKGATEIEAGGGIFGDRYYSSRGVDHPIALTVLSTVVSRPTPTRVVTDAGRKAIMLDDHAEPWPKNVGGVKSIRISSEHGQFELEAPLDGLRVGDKLEWYVGYCDMTVFLHDEMYGVRNGIVEVVWPILARGKIQ